MFIEAAVIAVATALVGSVVQKRGLFVHLAVAPKRALIKAAIK